MTTRKAQRRLVVFAHSDYDQECMVGYDEYPMQPYEKPITHHRVIGKQIIYDVVSTDFVFGYRQACAYAVAFHEGRRIVRLSE